MASQSVHRQVLDLILTASDRQPHPSLPKVLDDLFKDIRAALPSRPADDIEALIWENWTQHPSSNANDGMDRALRMIGARSFEVAERVLDRLVEEFPDWPEAWNKRATLLFILERDDESTADIARTLTLEPRHFGALCGFAQICLKRGDEAGALIAFEEALRVHPRLDDIRDVVDALSEKLTGATH